jgi:hypothetical protein
MDPIITLTLTACPACAAPAEVLSRFLLASTAGPVEHVRLQCIRRHLFVTPVAALAAGRRRRTAPPA